MRKNKKNYVIFAIICLLALLTMALSLFLKKKNEFNYSESRDEVIATTTEGTLYLHDLNYYVMIEEESVNETAIAYDEENPKAYWNLYIDNTFVNEEARRTVIDYMLKDYLISLEAIDAGVSLSKAEEEDSNTKAIAMASDLNERQIAAGITEDDLIHTLSINALSNKYSIMMAKDANIDLTDEAISAFYGINSKYFKNLKKKYDVKLNDKLIEKISLGTITIN